MVVNTPVQYLQGFGNILNHITCSQILLMVQNVFYSHDSAYSIQHHQTQTLKSFTVYNKFWPYLNDEFRISRWEHYWETFYSPADYWNISRNGSPLKVLFWDGQERKIFNPLLYSKHNCIYSIILSSKHTGTFQLPMLCFIYHF